MDTKRAESSAEGGRAGGGWGRGRATFPAVAQHLNVERWDSLASQRRARWPLALKVLGAVVLGVIAVLVLSAQLRHSDTQAYALKGPVERVVVDVDAGRVEIVGVPGPDARVVRSRHSLVGAASATTQRVDGGLLRVIGVCPGGLVLNCRTDFRIEAPAGAIVEVITASADVSVDGMTSSVEVTSKGGTLRLRKLGGKSLVAKTGAGAVSAIDIAATQVDVGARRSVTVAMTKVGDSVSIETVKGPVDVSIPDAPYKVKTDSAIGVVKVDVTQSPGARRSIDVTAPEGDIRVHPA